MKFYVDMSLYSSPNDPYANVTGYVELAEPPRVGDLFMLIGETATGPAVSVPVVAVGDAVAAGCRSISLEDYVLDGCVLAKAVGRRLGEETKLHVYLYGEEE